MILGIYYFFKGYLTAEISGRLNEKIINKCIREGIFMWNVRASDSGLRMNIRSYDAEKLKELLSGADLHFSDKRGLPFIFKRFRKRYALIFGALIFACIISFLSSLVWDINISGCGKTNPDVILGILEKNGVKKWSFKKSVDEEYLKVVVMNELDTLSWINIEIKGTALNIQVKERRKAPDMLDTEAYDLVASKDGVVSLMMVRNGENAVNPGDTVIKGQVLVSALVERDGEHILENPYTVHSHGEVIARTWYTFDLKQQLSDRKKEYTGEKITRRRLKIAGFDINLYFKGRILYEEYDKIVSRSGRFVGFEKETVRETKITETVYSPEQGMERAVKTAERMLPNGIITAKCLTKEYTVGDGFINAHIVFECTENIAVEMPYKERRETIDDGKDSEIQ